MIQLKIILLMQTLNATDEEIIKACKFAAADEFIKKLPKWLQYYDW